MMDSVAIFNAFEAGWWGVLGLVVLFAMWGRQGPRVWLAAGLIVFGVSDVIEIGSGAWWRPWWLLVLKGGCVVVIVVAAWLWRRGRMANGTA